MKPKLCFILSQYDPNTSTHYFHLHELLTHLSSHSNIFFFAESGQRQVQISGINNFYVQRFRFLPFRLLERTVIIVWLRLTGYRNFYCHYSDVATLICSTVTRILGGTTYKWHCVQEHYYQTPMKIKHIPEKIYRELPLHLSFMATQKLVTSSSQMKQYYHSYFGLSKSKIIAIPNSINLNRFSPAANKRQIRKQLQLPQKPIVLFVHRLSKRKGADRLIVYAQKLKQLNSCCCLVAVGSGPLEKSLRQQVSQLQLSNHLKLEGSIPNSKLPLYYQAASIFIMPSRIEEFARVQLEAMATGLPIVATRTLATTSMLSQLQKTLIVSQGRHQQIPNLVHQLLINKALHKQLVQEGYQQVKKYSLEAVTKLFTQKIILS